MLVKQIDRNRACELAGKGIGVKIIIPGPEGSEWEEARTSTMDQLLEGCLFFRDEPVAIEPVFARAVEEMVSVSQAQTETAVKVSKRAAGCSVDKKINVGKIHALYDAGWTQKKIADEIGISPATVNKYVRQGGKTDEESETISGTTC